jgi:Tfp pilus assembly protein FimV
MLAGIAWMGLGAGAALGQEPEEKQASQVVHNAPESVTGTLEGNQADLLSSWRFLSGLAVRLLSGNEAELFSGNSPELLSGNEPELLSDNKTSFLSDNEPNLLSGNKVTLFSHNTLEIHLSEGALKGMVEQGGGPKAAVEAKAKAMLAEQKAQATAMMSDMKNELNALRAKLEAVAAENNALKAKLAEREEAEE